MFDCYHNAIIHEVKQAEMQGFVLETNTVHKYNILDVET